MGDEQRLLYDRRRERDACGIWLVADAPGRPSRELLDRAAVVEGVGDHGCEYMTASTVVVVGGRGSQPLMAKGRHDAETCRNSGAEHPELRPAVHACDWWWLDHQVELRRDELDRFERELEKYLRSPRGRFDLWDAQRMRRGTM